MKHIRGKAYSGDRLKETSPFSYLKRWRLGSCIVKAYDQLRQEMFATRLIAE